MRSALLSLLLAAACTRDLEVPPPQTGALRGRVTRSGSGVGGAEVRLDSRPTPALTRADGVFAFKPVPAGDHALAAAFDSESDGLKELTAALSGIAVGGGSDVDVGDIELLPTGSAIGTVRARGAPLPDAMVFMRGTALVAFTNAEGRYVLSGLPAGTNPIAASGTGLVPQLRELEVPAGTAVTGVDFDLADATGVAPAAAFTGTVRLTDAPLEQAQATALAYSGARLAAAADTEAGAFTLGPLAPGVFSVRVDAPNHRTRVLPLQPLGLDDVDLGEVWLEPGTPSPPGPDTVLPMPDAGFVGPATAVRQLVYASGDGRITLSWQPPAAGAQRYHVYRGTDPLAAPPALDGGVTADVFFVDAPVPNYTRFVYRVTAVQSGIESRLDEAPQVSAYAGPGTVLSGASGSRTLTPAGNPHVVTGDDLTVLPGQSLVLAPGTVVQIDPRLRIWVQGALVARGTAMQPVVFTSRLAQPWSGLVFENTAADAVLDAGVWVAGSVLEHCVVEKSNDTGVRIIGASPALLECEIRNNTVYRDAGIIAAGGGLFVSSGSAPFVRGCSIHHNEAGILEDQVVSTQYGAGIYSEGDPVLVANDISFNVLEGSIADNQMNQGAGMFLRGGQATVCGNRFFNNGVTGGGQANAAQTFRTRGVAIVLDDGAHLLLGNTIEGHTLTRADWSDVRGVVWARAGNHLLVRNRIASNVIGHNMGTFTRVGGALAIETANVRAHLNQLAGNRLQGNGTASGSAVYSEATTSDLRFNDFSGNTPLAFEVYNTGVVPLNLSGSWFEDALLPDGGPMPVDARVFRPASADLTSLSATPVAGTGPKPCSADADCAPLGGVQQCWYGQCVPRCLVVPCPALMTCEPFTGACQ